MTAPPPSPRILIVDDDRVMGELLIALLAHRGYAVTHAHSGPAALDLIQQRGPDFDIVLCDVHMPGLTGAELASALLVARKEGKLPPTTLLLGMSGSAPSREEAQLFDRFLQKPFTMEDVAAAIDEARADSTHVATSDSTTSSTTSPEATAHATPPPLPSPLDERIFSQLRSKLPDDQLRQLYEMALSDVRSRLEQMAAAAERGETATVRSEAHAIKGGCGMVGALELQQLAAATEGGSALDTSALADFSSACQRLQRMLDERFSDSI